MPKTQQNKALAPIAQLQKLAEELQHLRTDIDAAEMRLFMRAAEIEASVDVGVWKEFYGSFDSFLQHFNICASNRYRDFLAAMTNADVARSADAIGVAATIQA